LEIRFPQATRPWQHVLALVDGYLTILAGMVGDEAEIFNRAFNLGPMEPESISVSELISLLSHKLPGVRLQEQVSEYHEAGKLGLDSSLAAKTFGWNPNWDTETAIGKTADWYKEFLDNKKSAYQLCIDQIDSWKESDKSAEGE
jgi:CDP-glucose 4,6-dehydratase